MSLAFENARRRIHVRRGIVVNGFREWLLPI
jgi:hypothetical protein